MDDLLKTIRKTLFIPIHPAGWPFIAAFAALAFVLALFSEGLGAIGAVLTLWCIYFFRNPVRTVPQQKNLVISPADGLVSKIQSGVSLPAELDQGEGDDEFTRVSIFLNVFDVHVNRIPVDGEIKQVVYKPGKFLNASLDKASEDNERSSVLMKTENDKEIAFVQIAGLIARRIINTLEDGKKVEAGQYYGLIRFGSRVDVYLPEGVEPLVCVGQRMIGGETILADMARTYPAMEGKAI